MTNVTQQRQKLVFEEVQTNQELGGNTASYVGSIIVNDILPNTFKIWLKGIVHPPKKGVLS